MIRVLLAEDQAMVRGALATLLGLEHDVEVVAQVSRGDEVLDAARTTRPDVALLDIEMPGGDGLSAAAALRAELPGVRVLILTTFGRPGYLRRAMESGACGFLLKDAPADELVRAIRRAMAGERVVDAALAAAESSTCRRGRSATISRRRCRSSGRARAPRRSSSPRRRAGCKRPQRSLDPARACPTAYTGRVVVLGLDAECRPLRVATLRKER